jgi:hypothetical protein
LSVRVRRIPAKLSRLYWGYLGRGLVGTRGPLRPPWHWVFDRLDERRARRRRLALGKRQWLVSWERAVDGGWRARLSCPSLVSTLERTGKTRTKAIDRSTRALTLLLAFRTEVNRRRAGPGRGPVSPDDAGG